LAGCNLSCWFYDTKYALKDGRLTGWQEVAEKLKLSSIRRYVWTGGEPSLQIKKIIEKLKKDGCDARHEIETNGTIKFNPKLFDKVIISPKVERLRKGLVRWFNRHPNVYFKFVCKRREDFVMWKDFVENNRLHLDKSKIYFMPEGVCNDELQKRGRWLAELCEAHNYNFSPRLQIWLGIR
ncbi:MAG: hypothetical protein KKB21_04565, partial [Nanoarchaeota archaeon]|nr:hypothetical protein [Nanoarchaeota archaeon]